MHIIIKNGTKHFTPHYNRTMGRYYGDKHEYLSDLKAKGFEPYNPDNVKTREVKKYKPSEWARSIVKHVESSGYVSGNIQKELAKAGTKAVPKELKDKINGRTPERKGGWF